MTFSARCGASGILDFEYIARTVLKFPNYVICEKKSPKRIFREE